MLRFFRTLIDRESLIKDLRQVASEALLRGQRLEIALEGLTMRVAALESRLSALDHTVRGRLGGRPPKQHNGSGGLTVPLPLGAQHFPPNQE